nr:hypothetical protein [Streptomyces sp. ST1015]
MPKELTAARRMPGTRQGPASAAGTKGAPDQSKSGLGVSWCRLAGTTPCSSARTALISPATPAAASRWPTLVFTEPTRHPPGCPPARSNASRSAVSSTGSPTGVPVPCASTYPMLRASRPASASAVTITSVWPAALGALKPTLRSPSLLTAVPRITARIVSPSASASGRRLRTTAPAPSPALIPAAPASNARTRPSGEYGPSCTYR